MVIFVILTLSCRLINTIFGKYFGYLKYTGSIFHFYKIYLHFLIFIFIFIYYIIYYINFYINFIFIINIYY